MGRKKIILPLILALAFFLRLINLNQSFWLDEAAQMIESSRPFVQQFDLTADFHPPLYHLLLHFWLKADRSEIYARLPGVFMGTWSVFVLYRMALLLNLKKAALPAALLLSVSPFHIYYSQEVRPYMLFSFLSLVSIYYWFKPHWLKYTVVNIFLIYTNYFSVFLLGGQLCSSVFFRKKLIKRNLRSILISAAFFLPWLPNFFRSLSVGLGSGLVGWKNVVSENPIRNIPLTFAKFIVGKASFNNNYLYALVLLPTLLMFLLSCLVIRKKANGPMLLSLFFFPMSLTFLVSLFLPVTAPQRLIFLLPIFILIIAAPFDFIRRKIFYVSFSPVFLTFLLGLLLYYLNPRFQRENWRQSISYLNNTAPEKHVVLFSFPEPFAPFLWYNSGYLNGVGLTKNFRIDDKSLRQLDSEIEDKQEIYYYGYLSALTDPKNMVLESLDSKLTLSEIKDFPGVGFVYRYEK